MKLRRWLRRKLRAAGYDFYDRDVMLPHLRWMDHMRVENNLLISEPYGPLDDDVICDLQAFCAELDITYQITSASSHYPFRTVRIALMPKERDSPYVNPALYFSAGKLKEALQRVSGT